VFKKAAEDWERIRLGADQFRGEVQVIRLGGLDLVGIPGEPFPDFDVAFKRESLPTHGALCIGYANDYLGYIAPPSAWQMGGYEVALGMWSIVGPQAYDLLLNEARLSIHEIWQNS